jgi:hypothetical protein
VFYIQFYVDYGRPTFSKQSGSIRRLANREGILP